MKTKESITLSDVAKAAGVSPATVSRVLNRHVQINDRTRRKVFTAINHLGYDTSSIDKKAAAIAQSKVKLLNIELLLCPLEEQKNMLSLEYFNEIINGIQSFFGEIGNINLTLSTWEADAEKYQKQNDNIFKKLIKADGVLITGNPSDELIKQLLENRINPVFISTDRDDLAVNAVGSDNLTGGMLAARYLIDRGHKKIGYINGPERIYGWTSRKMGAMLETINRLGPNHFISPNAASTENTDIAECLREWFSQGDIPDGLIVPTASTVLAVDRVMLEMGLKCPEDISLITFGQPYLGIFPFKVTYLDPFPRQIGIKAAQRLIQMLNFSHSEEKPHKVIISMQFIEGDSVKDRRF